MAGNVIDITAAMGGFDQPKIKVKAGKPVTIRLTSLNNSHHTDGGGNHQWAVDEIVFVLPQAVILLLTASRPTLNRLAYWNIHSCQPYLVDTHRIVVKVSLTG